MTDSLDIAIIGGGPAGLIAAEKLSARGFSVAVYDRMPSIGRKLLMAGRGGLNLTHAEAFEEFLKRYKPFAPQLESALKAFDSLSLRAWAQDLGQPTFVGSSGRVFPEAMKASPLLRAWLKRLETQGVTFHPRHTLENISESGELRFSTPEGEKTVHPRATLLALGGASWPRLGSDGAWTKWLDAPLTPLEPSNCGLIIPWSDVMKKHAGTPLKRITVRIGPHEAVGEAMITETGLEGGVIYALSRPIRMELERNGKAEITLDLKSDFRPEWITYRLKDARAKDSLSSKLRKAAGLQPNAVSLVFEAAFAQKTNKADYAQMAALVRAAPLTVTGLAGIARAISTAGGVKFSALDEHFMLKDRPGVFVAGEMLDWEAPTGGYLLQGCFATGIAAAEGMAGFLG